MSTSLAWVLPEADPRIRLQVLAVCSGGEENAWRGVQKLSLHFQVPAVVSSHIQYRAWVSGLARQGGEGAGVFVHAVTGFPALLMSPLLVFHSVGQSTLQLPQKVLRQRNILKSGLQKTGQVTLK